MNKADTKACFSCGRPMRCTGALSGNCWCMAYPPVLKIDIEKDCLCDSCLKQKVILEIKNYLETITPANAVQNKAKNLPITSELIEEIDYYIENGLYVFTSWYHLKRGYCCENGCRHCPYRFEK